MCTRNGGNLAWEIVKVDEKLFLEGKFEKFCTNTSTHTHQPNFESRKVNEKTVDIFYKSGKDLDSNHLSPSTPLIEIYCIIRSCLIYPNHGLPNYGTCKAVSSAVSIQFG